MANKEIKLKDLIEMKLGEQYDVNDCHDYYKRVPNGWIYYGYDYDRECYMNGVFVPERDVCDILLSMPIFRVQDYQL